MIIMPRSLILRVFFSLLIGNTASVLSATPAPEIKEILNLHWEALGGMHNWSKVESIRLNGTIQRKEDFVDICIVKKNPNQIRATITLPPRGETEDQIQIIRAHDGKKAWTATRLAGASELKKQALSPEAAAALLSDAGVLPPLIKLWRDGAEISRQPPSVINGIPTITIQAKPKDSAVRHIFYLCEETYLVLLQESDNGVDEIIRTHYSDYTTSDGLQFPARSIIDSSQTGRTIMTTQSVEIGVGIYDGYFTLNQLPENTLNQ